MLQQIAVHQHQSPHIVINYPGYRGHIDGYNDKHKKIANLLVFKNIAAVVRMSNWPIEDVDYTTSVTESLREVIQHVLENAEGICGTQHPALFLLGLSAGASATIVVAHEFQEVDKILLVAPSLDAGFEDVQRGIEQYAGELYVTVGAQDHVAGTELSQHIIESSKQARKKELVIVPDCDHQFRGERNGRILSKAPLWAFSHDTTYPCPDGGIALY